MTGAASTTPATTLWPNGDAGAPPAELCDIDHAKAYAAGGSTSAANTGPACGRHHELMTSGG